MVKKFSVSFFNEGEEVVQLEGRMDIKMSNESLSAVGHAEVLPSEPRFVWILLRVAAVDAVWQ